MTIFDPIELIDEDLDYDPSNGDDADEIPDPDVATSLMKDLEYGFPSKLVSVVGAKMAQRQSSFSSVPSENVNAYYNETIYSDHMNHQREAGNDDPIVKGAFEFLDDKEKGEWSDFKSL